MARCNLSTLVVAVLGGASFVACSADSSIAPSAVAPAVIGQSVLANGSGGPEYADVANQGGGGVYAANGAMLVRQPDGLRASMSVPTPQPDTYNYPAGRVSGHPEVFTVWAFIFNFPNLCSPPACSADDLGAATPARGGVYNVGGHLASGKQLTIAGRIAVGEEPFNPATAPLESPATAEVHLALAPHGWVDPHNRATEFNLPTGPMTFWWIAIFD